MSEPGVRRGRILILCVDRDNDIGVKTGVETPIVSRESNLRSAVELALIDPEEADANAMFAAIRLYDRLSADDGDESFEVATITGSPLGGVDADRKLVSELDGVLERFPASGVVLVSDGFTDETVVPIIQSRAPITSIQRVVVKHSERLEETWAVLFRYTKTLLNEPHYSRFVLGVPGIMLVVLGALLIYGQLENAGMALTFIMGAVLIIKGFGWDRRIASIRLVLPPPERQLTLASLTVGVIFSLIGGYLGVVDASHYVPIDAPPVWENLGYWLQLSPMLLSAFLLRAIDLIFLGGMVALIGGFASYYMQKDHRKWQNVVGMIVTFWLRIIGIESAKVLQEPNQPLTLASPLIVMTMWGLVTTLTAVFLIYRAYRRIPLRFYSRDERREQVG